MTTDIIVKWLQGIEPRARVRAAVRLFFICLFTWPATSLTVLSSEPQGVLGLSWFAIMLECVVIVLTTDLREQQD